MRPRLRCWAGCAMEGVLHADPGIPGPEPGGLTPFGAGPSNRAGLLDQPQPVLQLGDPELELFEVLSRDDPELGEHGREALARPLADPRRVPTPPADRGVEQRTRLVAAHPAPLRELGG